MTTPPISVVMNAALLGLCSVVMSGCPRPWIPVRPDALGAGGAVEAALVGLRDETVATLSEPRLDGAGVTARAVLRCQGAACAEVTATRRVPLSAVASMGVWYVRPPPNVRLDVDFALPVVLVLPGADVKATLGAGAGLRFATRSGLGGAVTFSGAGDPSDLVLVNSSVQTAHGDGWLLDAMALYRLRPVGGDRRGIGVDLSLGLSVANIGWDPGHGADDCGFIDLFCTPTWTISYTPPPQAFTSGYRAGPVLGVSVDGRLDGLVGGVGVAYRALFFAGSNAIAAEPIAQQALTVYARVGFGFSL